MNVISIKSRFIILLVLATLFSILVVGYLGWRSSRDALNDAIFNQLTSVRTAKARQIEDYFRSMRNQVVVLAEDHMVASAMVRLNRGYQQLTNVSLSDEEESVLGDYYADVFVPTLADNLSDGSPNYNQFRPQGQVARYLQYHYLAANGNARGYKHFLDDAADNSDYSKFHAEYQPRLRELALRFGYYDLFLINIDSGEIVYSVFKETDYGTNLLTGPYRTSGLADVVRAVQENPTQQSVQIVDFQPYLPSYNVPAGFIAGPIYNGTHPVGILALQFPVDQFNHIMTGGNQWEADALGDSGETYLIGADQLMRSDSRFLLQDPDGYKDELRRLGVPTRRVDLIEKLETTILLQHVDTVASRKALAGEAQTEIIDDYRGISVLSSFAPLNIEGLEWGIIAEIDATEVFEPLQKLQRSLWISAAILISLVTLFAPLIISSFLRPLSQILDRTKQSYNQEEPLRFDANGRDEFGELSQRLNMIMAQVHDQSVAAAEKEEKYNTLLARTFPQSVVPRYDNIGMDIVDQTERGTVIYCIMSGSTGLTELDDPRDTLALQSELSDAFFGGAQRSGLDLFNQIGNEFVVICGLTTPHLDYARRSVGFALSMLKLVTQFNMRHNASLSLQLGIDSGTIMGGLIGGQKVQYDVWGKTVETARNACLAAPHGSVVLTESTRSLIHEIYSVTPHTASEHTASEHTAFKHDDLTGNKSIKDESITSDKQLWSLLIPESDEAGV